MFQRHFQPQLQRRGQVGKRQLPKPFHPGKAPVRLHIVCHINDGFQQIHARFSRGVAADGGNHRLIFPKNPLRHHGTGEGVEGSGVFS